MAEDPKSGAPSPTATPEDQAVARRQRVVLPVSKATGGFAPGITSLIDVQEMEDQEYIERMGLGARQVLIVGELDEAAVTEIETARYGEPT